MASSVVINGVTYADVPEVDMPQQGGGTAKFYDSSDATAGQGDILSGKSAYIDGGKVNGNMPNNGDTSGTIESKSGTVSVPAGYTSGGTVGISAAEQAKIIAGNIKSGVTILGQAGDSNVVNTQISSGGAAQGDIISGKKAYVNGVLVEGNATVPVVSQDSTTKVLSIS